MRYLLSILILTNIYSIAQDQEPHLVGCGWLSSIYKIVDDQSITIKELKHSQAPQHFGLLSSGGKLWGTTTYGGELNMGVIFSIGVDGSEYKVVHEFSRTDGSLPVGGLIEFEGRYWGLASAGGEFDSGVIYSLKSDGTDYQVASHFNSINGASPISELTLSNGEMWGVARFGGTLGNGTIFSFSPTSGFQKRHDFTLEDGFIPIGKLQESNGRLWGTTIIGGLNFSGVIFSIATDGSAFRVDHNFDYSNGGSNPVGGVIASNGRLWGVATSGEGGGGTIFSISNSGGDFSVLYDFPSSSEHRGTPWEKLLASDGKLWGISTSGGAFDFGYIYSINENGTSFTNHYDFKIATSDGRVPWSPLIKNGDRIWGSTVTGGDFGNGILFSLASSGSDYQIEHQFNDVEATGWWPNTDFIDEGDKIIGSTRYGGKFDCGVVYSMNKDGSEYLILHHFDLENGSRPASIKKINGKLWGVTVSGGSFSRGTIFSMNIDGSAFEKRHDFDGISGASPAGYLVESNGLLWGVAQDGNTGAGSIFNFNPESGAINYVHNFEFFTGADPAPGLLIANGKFWGTANGGNTLYGVIFTIDLNGGNYSVVHEFDSESGGNTKGPLVSAAGKIWGVTDSKKVFSINEDGSNYTNHQTIQGDLDGGLVLFENRLFGVANVLGGSPFVYSISTNGTGLQTEASLDATQYFPQHGQTLQIINFPTVPVTGLPETLATQMNAYPNPATNNIFLELPKDNLPVEIKLQDIHGRVFERRVISQMPSNATESIDVSLLPSGLYIVTLQTTTESKKVRILIK